MNYTQLLQYIAQWIRENHNNEITGNILQDVLIQIVEYTKDNNDVFDADIQNLQDQIDNISIGQTINVFEGVNDPNIIPPEETFSAPDIYVQTNQNRIWIFNGEKWIDLTYEIDVNIRLSEIVIPENINTKSQLVSYINALSPSLEKLGNENWILTNSNHTFFLVGKGKGKYGDNEQQIDIENIIEIAAPIDLSTGLEAIDEGNGIGWRLIGRNPANYGDIGKGAIDLGASDSPSTTVGATGDYSTVGGGERNKASGNYSNVVGGYDNAASGSYSFIGGGRNVRANALYSTVSGGNNVTASGDYSTVSGGNFIGAFGDYSTVSGGLSNEASGSHSTVSGGRQNEASGSYSTVSGGRQNEASGSHSTVSGGENVASGDASTVGGGQLNEASGTLSTVGGGWGNEASGTYSAVSGGINNIASGTYSAVSGGINNIAKTFGEFLGGLWATIKEGNAGSWLGTDRIFGIGNGKSGAERSDAFNVYKNGVAELPSVTNSLIDEASAKAIPTKEWVENNFIEMTDLTAINLFIQYSESSVLGDSGVNLIQPDLGLPILEIEDLQEDSSYSGELVLDIENNNIATAKVIELFGAEIYNSTNPSAAITAKITFTLNFFNQDGDDIDYKLSWEYLSSGEVLFGEHTGTIDNTSNVDFELLVTGHSTDGFNLKKARLWRF